MPVLSFWPTTFITLAVFCMVCDHIYAQSKVTQSEDGSSGTISFSTPDLSDDDAHSPWVPDQMKCDACRAVSYQLWRGYTKFNDKRKSFKYELPESEILELSDRICENEDVWQDYGIKQVKKMNRLSGPGMDIVDVPGVTAGGGKWPARLRDMCEQFMGEVGEIKIYQQYKKNPKSRKRVEDLLCRGKEQLGACRGVDKDKPGKEEL